MIKDYVVAFCKDNIASLIGALIGLVVSVLIITIGLFNTVFIVLFVTLGYYVGQRLSRDRECIKKFLDKILPPGTYR